MTRNTAPIFGEKTLPVRTVQFADGGRSKVEHKSLPFEVKSLDDNGSFVLYAAVFGNTDHQGDEIQAGAFLNLESFVKDGWGALNHQSFSLPVALIDDASQDDHGLKITGRFHSHPEAQACRTVVKERMEAGKSVKTSIGYIVKDAVEAQRDGKFVRILKGLEVYEFSFVNLPANPEAEVISAKSQEPSMPDEQPSQSALDSLKAWLGLSTKGGRKMSAENLKRFKAVHEMMEQHHEKAMDHCKAMATCHKHMKSHMEEGVKMAEEFGKCLKAFEPGKPRDEEDAAEEADEDEGYADEDESGEPKKRKKAAAKVEKPEDTADGDPPKGKKKESDEDKTKSVYREQLRTRALAGRRTSICP